MNQPSTSIIGPGTGNNHHRQYNFKHFLTKHVVKDLWRTVKVEGIRPGAEAPDFELESTRGERMRLSAFRGRPVVLRFGSFT
jgi:cytochrome oxidase Cu insertion factor (SCO1/SenC/PrrC family)